MLAQVKALRYAPPRYAGALRAALTRAVLGARIATIVECTAFDCASDTGRFEC